MQLAGTRDAIRLYVETQLFALDTVTRLILDSGIAWQAPNVYEHRDSKWNKSGVFAEGVAHSKRSGDLNTHDVSNQLNVQHTVIAKVIAVR